MDDETIEEYAKYRLEKAKETLHTAELILKEIKDYSSANNRAYYAIFYAIRAVLALEQMDFKRHKDVIAYEVLHTQGDSWLVKDIEDFLKVRGYDK